MDLQYITIIYENINTFCKAESKWLNMNRCKVRKSWKLSTVCSEAINKNGILTRILYLKFQKCPKVTGITYLRVGDAHLKTPKTEY